MLAFLSSVMLDKYGSLYTNTFFTLLLLPRNIHAALYLPVYAVVPDVLRHVQLLQLLQLLQPRLLFRLTIYHRLQKYMQIN